MSPAQGLLLVRLGADIVAGDRKDAIATARQLMALAVEMVPVDELKEFLTDRDRIFAELATDVAEQIKLDGSADR